MTGWREKRREARWKRKARMRNLERINKNKKCLAAKIIWICSRLPWRRELKSDGQKWLNSNYGVAFREGVSWNDFLRNLSPDADPVAFREGVSWNSSEMVAPLFSTGRLPWRRELKFSSSKISSSIALRRLPWRRELKSRTAIQRSCLIRRLPWRRELRILAFRPYKCAVIERL